MSSDKREYVILRRNFLNDQPFTHLSKNGITFEADRCDFKGGVRVTAPNGVTNEMLLEAVAEMIAHHAVNIHPRLNGFAGYDTVKFIFI